MSREALQRRVQPRPIGLVSAALPLSAPSRLRVSRSDARGDAEHAEQCRTRHLLSIACSTLSNKTNLCENCYKSALPHEPSGESPQPCKAKPTCASHELQQRPYRSLAISYRLSAIGYDKPSAIHGKARLRVLELYCTRPTPLTSSLHPSAYYVQTSLQKRTAETPGAQRVKKTNHDGCTAKHTCA